MKVWAIVPAAGSGRRMGAAERKQFLSLGGSPVLAQTLSQLSCWPRLTGIVVVAPKDEVGRTRNLVAEAGIPQILRVVGGGAERQGSVRQGLRALGEADEGDVVLVHDGVRPFPPTARLDRLLEEALPDGALFALPCPDTLKREEQGRASETVARTGLWLAQTPQAFPVALLRQAMESAEREGFRGTDEASLVERLGRHPRLLPGEPTNIKVTVPEDMALAESILASRADGDRTIPCAVGHGYDVHRFAAGRPLILGGVEIAHERGLLGHSDADVLAHAVADACLGGAGLGDIGRHFPNTDARWEGASSLVLLTLVRDMVEQAGLRVLRVDATVVAEKPKIAGSVPAMEQNLSQALGLGSGGVTVKGTTTEGLGFEGRQEGVSAHAVALLGTLGPSDPFQPRIPR